MLVIFQIVYGLGFGGIGYHMRLEAGLNLEDGAWDLPFEVP